MSVIPDNIVRLTHCTFTCKDYAAMKHFYGEVLGLKELFHLPYTKENIQGFLRSGFDCPFQPGDEWLSYFKVSEKEFIELFSTQYVGENEVENQGFHHVCLVVEDLEEAAQDLQAKGCVLLDAAGDPYTGRGDAPDAAGCWSFFLRDPEGNSIEISEYAPDSPCAK